MGEKTVAVREQGGFFWPFIGFVISLPQLLFHVTRFRPVWFDTEFCFQCSRESERDIAMGEVEILYLLRILQQGLMFELSDHSMVEKACVFDQVFTRSSLYIFLMYISRLKTR